jgi:hypothetical protein
MKRTIFQQYLLAALGLSIWIVAPCTVTAQTPRDAVETMRADLKADRKAVIGQELQMSAEESEAFWPIYATYRAEVDKSTDRVVELVLEYADLYPNVPEKKAAEMLDQYLKIETELLKVKRKYLKKLGKVLPAAKVFRFAQLDNRYDLGTRVGMAASIPMLPASQTPPSR